MEDRYVRRDVRTPARADVWDDASLAYARAVGVTQARPPEDPTSWAAQAALHRCCPRGTWFFLPWARMQLWYLERILRAIVAEAGGPRDWALPFWSYGDGPASAVLPRAFAAPAMSDGSPNPLYRPDGERAACLNAGRPLPDAVASAARALAARTFSPGLGGDPGIPDATEAARPPGPPRRGGGRAPGPPGAPAARPGARRARRRRAARPRLPAAPRERRPPLGGVARARRGPGEPGPVRLGRPRLLLPRRR